MTSVKNKVMYEVLDDFIPADMQQIISDEMMGATWRFGRNVSSVQEDPVIEGHSLARHQNGFHSSIFDIGAPAERNNDRLTGLLLPLISKAANYRLNDKAVDLMRIKGGLFVHGESGVHKPHLDYYIPHWTFLYYVNDSDGDTFIFDQVAEPVDMNIRPLRDPVYPSKFTVAERVSPKAGRLVIMDGLLYHSSSAPVEHGDRMTLTFNFVPRSPYYA